MCRYIIITSIFSPSVAVRKFASIDGYDLIVVGDKKTPPDWNCENVDFISLKAQQPIATALSDAIPLNHYSRKMIGYVKAKQDGADIIIDTDDDNIPQANWRFPEFEGKFEQLETFEDFVNIYQWFTDAKTWPRGLPLDLINTDFDTGSFATDVDTKIGVWQGLADGDPDVDAIYRLVSDTPVEFIKRDPLIIPKGTISPYNSQNTATRRELFALLYLPAHVTFRFTDILRGLVAQPIMWLYDYSLGFTEASVYQERNPHDYMKDFESEVPMYLHTRKVVELVSGAISASKSIEDNLGLAYRALRREGIVVDEELRILDAWLEEIAE